jgi:hypothetical protein
VVFNESVERHCEFVLFLFLFSLLRRGVVNSRSGDTCANITYTASSAGVQDDSDASLFCFVFLGGKECIEQEGEGAAQEGQNDM